MIAGVDGCKDKWIAAVDAGDGSIEIWEPCSFVELFENCSLDLIVIDIPIGLPDYGRRKADKEAKEFLRRRHVCVFPAPIRPILDCHTREEACDVCLGLGEKRVNVFQWAIVPKVKDIDLVLRRQDGIQDRIREGHPEVSFARINGDTPLLSKKKPIGLEQRKNLLRSYFPDLPINTPHFEDVLDAYALLWTAKRIERNTEQRFPEAPEFDRYALRMEIAA